MSENNVTEFTLSPVNVKVYFENIQSVSEEQYALIRRGGLGASDASVFMGLMTKFNKDIPGLINEKLSTGISDEERAIGKKDSVRKGRDLEDMILEKFAKVHGCEKPIKPQHMYQICSAEYLTVNFDGVMREADCYIPIECKFVTTFGDKYYDRDVAYEREFPVDYIGHSGVIAFPKDDVIKMCEARAKHYGIPAYYYVQIQQQMLGLGSPYGYLAALHDKGWELCIYKIPRDEDVIHAIVVTGYKVSSQIEKRRT